MKERLIELLQDALQEWECDIQPETVSRIAEHLIENGVRVVNSGKWIIVGGDLGYVEAECSVCKSTEVFDDETEMYELCPRCGAEMERKQ